MNSGIEAAVPNDMLELTFHGTLVGLFQGPISQFAGGRSSQKNIHLSKRL